MSEDTTNSNAAPPKKSARRWIMWAVIAVVALVAIGGGVLAWYVLSSDSPDPLDTDDLSAALAETTVAGTDATSTAGTDPDTTTAGTQAPVATATAPTTVASTGDGAIDGTWNATDASVVRYRVDEVLFGANVTAVGETNAVTGGIVVAGTQVTDGSFEVDMATVESDRSQRDGQFRGRIMSVDEFPTATFELTEPIELGSVPAEGEQVAATATGDLTLRGVTNPVTFDVTAQLEGGRIGVLGSIPVVFADYDIPNPSFGGVETEDNGVLEFVLVFERP